MLPSEKEAKLMHREMWPSQKTQDLAKESDEDDIASKVA